MDVDDVFESIGGVSKYQIAVILASAFSLLAATMSSQLAVFLSATPTYRCALPTLHINASMLTHSELVNLFIPPEDSCQRYDYNLTQCEEENNLSCITNQTEVRIIPCDYGYHYDKTYYDQTTISEWDFICGRETFDSIANSCIFLGFFMGSAACGILMDKFGRNTARLICCIVFIVSGCIASFVPLFGVYLVFRVIMAGSGLAVYLCVFTYVTEISPKEYRTFFVTVCAVISGVSHTILPLLAYPFRSWRSLCLVNSLLATPFLGIYFLIPESPRWLICNGREDDAREVLKRIAKSKNVELNEEVFHKIQSNKDSEECESKKKYFYTDIFRMANMRMITIIIMLDWFVVSMVFYGLTLNVGRLAGDPYINATANAFIEVLGYSTYFIVARKIGSKTTTALAYFLGAICCISTMLLTEFSCGNQDMIEAGRWIAISGKFFASWAFQGIYQLTVTLHPTVTRGKGMALGSMAARVGSMIMPFTLQIQNSIPWLTQTIFGTLAFIACSATMLLPETRSLSLLTTVDEAENFYRKHFVLNFKKNGKMDNELVVEIEMEKQQA
uniref:organic cation transporter protein-like n=1 Tax=Styela clava TaxID=7725 RepID=UPI001939AFD3|nr:organic cation transporter protein-like [Styela clava]